MRIGTRGSMLALAQAQLVRTLIVEGGSGAPPNGASEPEIVVVRTSGDAQSSPNDPPHAVGGDRGRKLGGGDKSRWVGELEQALRAGEIDLAVHSAKDVPGELADGLELLGAPARASAEDALIGARSLDELPHGACVGTSSVRRAAQLRATRADLEVVSLRGNVDTRLRKLAHEVTERGERTDGDEPTLHAIVLAGAGLRRLGRDSDIGCTLDMVRFVPAPGQGALALQTRIGDEHTKAVVEPILDRDASACLTAERAVSRALQASCNTPLGAHATPAGCGCLQLRAWVGLPDGSQWVLDELLGGFYDPDELGRRMAERLETAGARELLAHAEEIAVERE
jgi:hydroxymethylbilane synthase